MSNGRAPGRGGLHLSEMFYGNTGSEDRLDFTVVGPAVNEVSRIAALCRSVDQPVLLSSAFASAVGKADNRLVSVGRYALRGVGQPQHLFTLDQGAGGLQGLTVPSCLIVKLWESDCRKHDRRCRRRSPLEPSLGIPSALATLMAVPGIARAVSPLQR